MIRIFYTILALLLCANSVFAAQLPRYLGSERKFRSFIYNPNDVYRYIGHYTYQGFIEFEEGEKISTISMGNPSLWLFENLGNRLFLKPVGEDNSETNMTVISSKRVYHFELVAKEAKGITDKDLIFVVKFVYPDEKDKNIVQFTKVPVSDEPDMRDISGYNFNYQYTGENTIAPMKVFDNGEFTYFQFAKKNAEIPAIFTVDAQGFESLVNFRAAGPYIIVERVAPQYTLRNGSDIVCVYNMSQYSTGRANNAIRREDGSLNIRNFPSAATDVSPASPAIASAPTMMPPVQSIPGMPSNLQIPTPTSSMPGAMPFPPEGDLPPGLLPPMPGASSGPMVLPGGPLDNNKPRGMGRVQ